MSAAGERPSPRRAIVTGAASGLGSACVTSLRARGCAVAALDLQLSEIEAEHVGICDVADVEATAAAVRDAAAALGGVDAAAHCAGIHPDRAMPLHEIDPVTWERVVAVNLTGSYGFARAVLPELVKTGGALVLVASLAASQPIPGTAAYAASKGGVAALARTIALEYADHMVRVNSISPGWIDTPMAAPVMERESLRDQVERAIPIGRVAAPEEVAAAVVWLLSGDASYVTGADLRIDGGLGVSALAPNVSPAPGSA